MFFDSCFHAFLTLLQLIFRMPSRVLPEFLVPETLDEVYRNVMGFLTLNFDASLRIIN